MKNLTHKFSCLLACACILFGATPHALADIVVVDNSPPNHLNGSNLGFAFQAEDFRLAAGATLTSVRFWSLEGSGAYRGNISWSIMSNGAGAPGATTLASGTQNSVSRTALGSYLDLTEYRNDFGLGTPLMLGAGTYWLVLHNGAPGNLGDPNEFYWETTAVNSTLRGSERFDRLSGWTSNGLEHAFQVSAVPEPAHVLMLLAGMTLVGCIRRGEARSARFV